jgi:hypothetical protein
MYSKYDKARIVMNASEGGKTQRLLGGYYEAKEILVEGRSR